VLWKPTVPLISTWDNLEPEGTTELPQTWSRIKELQEKEMGLQQREEEIEKRRTALKYSWTILNLEKEEFEKAKEEVIKIWERVNEWESRALWKRQGFEVVTKTCGHGR
jgi:hypothetical protein